MLQTIGKYGPEDELNCGGCGYDNCREFGKALIDGKAERVMCAWPTCASSHRKRPTH